MDNSSSTLLALSLKGAPVAVHPTVSKTFQAIEYFAGLSIWQFVQAGLGLALLVVITASLTTKSTIPDGVSYPWYVLSVLGDNKHYLLTLIIGLMESPNSYLLNGG